MHLTQLADLLSAQLTAALDSSNNVVQFATVVYWWCIGGMQGAVVHWLCIGGALVVVCSIPVTRVSMAGGLMGRFDKQTSSAAAPPTSSL